MELLRHGLLDLRLLPPLKNTWRGHYCSSSCIISFQSFCNPIFNYQWQRTLAKPLCDPGAAHRHPFSTAQSSNANQNPTQVLGFVFRKVLSWWSDTKILSLLLVWVIYLVLQFLVATTGVSEMIQKRGSQLEVELQSKT